MAMLSDDEETVDPNIGGHKSVSAIISGKAAIGGLPVDDFGKGAASGTGEDLGTIVDELGVGVGGTQEQA